VRWQNGTVEVVNVQLGLRNMTHSEIVSGVTAGDIVLQADNLRDGQRARVRFE
jgi:HlyD family secretion protein